MKAKATTKPRKKANSRAASVTRLKEHPSFVVETWPLHDIKPYERNARKIPESAIKKVAQSLQEFGWRQPMVVDKNGVLIVGHARRLAAVHLGWTEGPVHVATDLTPAQIRAYRLMDNRSHQETAWDMDILKPELLDLSSLDMDLTLTGFDLKELRTFLGEADSNGGERDGGAQLGSLEYRVIVECKDEAHQAAILADLEDQGLLCRALIS